MNEGTSIPKEYASHIYNTRVNLSATAKVDYNPKQLALTHASEILLQADKMKTELYEFSRKVKIFTVGFCAPGRLWYCTPRFSIMHPDIELKTNLYEESDDDVSLLLNQTNDVKQAFVLLFPP